VKLGKIFGVVWASKKVDELTGCRLHIVQPIMDNGANMGKPLVVADPENIGSVGDTVVYVTSTDATQVFKNGFAPVNASVVELVDEVA
jgi:ethanolamine utilization protein EutN